MSRRGSVAKRLITSVQAALTRDFEALIDRKYDGTGIDLAGRAWLIRASWREAIGPCFWLCLWRELCGLSGSRSAQSVSRPVWPGVQGLSFVAKRAETGYGAEWPGARLP